MPRGRPVVNRLELNAEQTATLKAIANSRSEELRRVQRAKAFLGAAAGRSQKEIAAEIGLSVSAVARMLRKALQIGPMMALDDLKRSGRPITIGEEARTWVKSIRAKSIKKHTAFQSFRTGVFSREPLASLL